MFKQPSVTTQRELRDLCDNDLAIALSSQFLTVTKLSYRYILMLFSFIFNHKISSRLQISDRSWGITLLPHICGNQVNFLLSAFQRSIYWHNSQYVFLVPFHLAFLLVEKISFESGKCYLIKNGIVFLRFKLILLLSH